MRKAIAFIGVGIIMLGMFSIYLSLQSRDDAALIMTDYSKTVYLSLTFMTSGLFVLGVLALVGAWKNPFACRMAFTALSITMMVMYAFYGIKMLIISSEIIAALETEECRMLKQYQDQAVYDNSIDDSKSPVYIIKNEWIELLNTIYSMGRNSYCKKSPYGCPCKTSSKNVTGFYYDNNHEYVVKNVQGWRDKILGSYEEYIIYLNLNEFESYFGFIGEIEKKHKCSGFWAQEDVYYFYDITKKIPKKSCDEALKDDIIPNTIDIFGSNLLAISACIFLWFFIHTGLYKREKYEKIKDEMTTNGPRKATTVATRVEEESQVSRF